MYGCEKGELIYGRTQSNPLTNRLVSLKFLWCSNYEKTADRIARGGELILLRMERIQREPRWMGRCNLVGELR